MDRSGIMSAASSAQAVPAEHICYVHCSFCNTILAVSVPGNSVLMFKIVTVRCGHCSNLLSVNMGALLRTFPFQSFHHQNYRMGFQERRAECGSDSNYKCTSTNAAASFLMDQEQLLPIRPPRKRQRVPSAYNRFIREEIQRIKANNPDISHREAFSTAAKNWAHIPHMQFGLTFDGSSKQAKLDEAVAAAPGGQKARSLC